MHSKTASLINSLPSSEKGLGAKFRKMLYKGSDRNLLGMETAEEVSMLRNEAIRDAYPGETAIILTCGPSIGEVCDDRFLKFISDKLVIAVKQAHDIRPDIVDIHLYNTVRLKVYEYPAPTMRISVERFFQKTDEYPCHINYPIKHETIVDHDVNKALMATNDYDRWSLDTEYERPWGIGIMFEIGLQLPVHLGCRRLLIVGFDMNRTGKYHFYRTDNTDARLYARDEEFEYSRNSIPHYLKYAEAHGLEVRQYSPLSALPIQKIDSFDEVVSWYNGT
jgi:hypothetical protein